MAGSPTPWLATRSTQSSLTEMNDRLFPLATLRTRRHIALVGELPLGSPAPDESLQHWLYRSLRQAIVSGRVPGNSILPGTRTLALQYGLARGTIQSVYCQLLAEGYLIARQGSATRVSSSLPDTVFRMSAAQAEVVVPLAAHAAQLDSPWFRRVEKFPRAIQQDRSDAMPHPFHPHRGDIRSFPIDLWRQLHVRHLRTSRLSALSGGDPAGVFELRSAISQHLAIARGVLVSPEQIVVMPSVRQALDLCTRLLIAPGDSVWMEDPGNAEARQIMVAAGAEVAYVPVDEEGLRVEEGVLAAPHARFVYVTPARHTPLGVALAPDRRTALLNWAVRQNAYIFEEDCGCESRMGSKPVLALKSLPHGERNVILAGTFGKLLFPALRLAFLVLPSQLVDPFRRAASLVCSYPDRLSQAVLADFMVEGHFDRHIRRMRKVYACRAEAFLFSAQRHWAGLIDVSLEQDGLDVVRHLVGLNEEVAHRRLARAGIEAFPLARYTSRNDLPPGLVMGFAPFNETEIDRAALTMSRVLQQAAA